MPELFEICTAIVVFTVLGWILWRMSNDAEMLYRLSHNRPDTSISRGLTKLAAAACFFLAGLSGFGFILWIVNAYTSK
jgi:hypothetical protein